MEILKNHEPTIYFEVPFSLTTASFTVSKNGAQLGGSSPASVSNGVAAVSIPYAVTASDGDVTVTLTFLHQSQSYQQQKKLEVVTPYLSRRDIRYIVGEEATNEEVEMIESSVRLIINAHCGQNFGKYIGSHSVTGSGEGVLRLPQRLISLTDINDNDYWANVVNLRGGGWFLQVKTVGVPTVRADLDGWHYDPSRGVISTPWSGGYNSFLFNQEYVINGVWGWEDVPAAVREAAKLLVNDYACGDNNYRDRFLTSMTAADWRIQFHEGAFSHTGNVRANQLLSEYVLRRGWLVL